MKRINLLLPLSAIILAGCSGNINSDSSEEVKPSEETSSEIIETNEATHEKVQTLIEQLSSVNGKVKRADIGALSQTAYMSDSNPVTVTSTARSVANRYTYQNRDLVETHSDYYMVDEATGDETLSYKEHSQSSYDEKTFYTVKTFSDSTIPSEVKRFTYDETKIESFISISFSDIETKNLLAFDQFIGAVDVEATMKNITDFTTNGVWKFTYQLTSFYKDSDVIQEELIFNNELTITDSKIAAAKQKIEDNKYYGGVKANWAFSETVFNFTYGEYDEFTGKYLNPSDYE